LTFGLDLQQPSSTEFNYVDDAPGQIGR
jgi:hypothetical protein